VREVRRIHGLDGGIDMAKMNNKWVILCSTAIAAVYAAGYFTTETQQPAQQPFQNIQSNRMPTNNSQMDKEQSTDSTQSTDSAPPTDTTQSLSRYKDGSYTGMGMNRRGSIQVTVTIKNDKITDVVISDFGMHYSESDVDGLPGEVLQIQSAQVQNVSGATYSTRAFEDAVQDALSQAQNA
jgi:uncharacterized protein with FMN-binding domain